jgi:hypothetical protein
MFQIKPENFLTYQIVGDAKNKGDTPLFLLLKNNKSDQG